MTVDAARSALGRVRRSAESRGERRLTGAAARAAAGFGFSSTPEHASARRARRRRPIDRYIGRDPQDLGEVVGRLVAERGWSAPVAVGSVMAQWSTLVGEDIAAHAQPESFEGTVLQVRCDSTTWATQLRLLTGALLGRFEAELGSGVVTRIQVLGPTAPNWAKGQRRVNGRGPRDTYG
nr:DciA family protein [Psychromicrobium sp. YIM S02556]